MRKETASTAFASGKSRTRVAVLALPGVNGFDLATAVQVFSQAVPGERYLVETCSLVPGVVATSTGYGVEVGSGVDALAAADTVVVPGHDDRCAPAAAIDAIRSAHDRGARMVSICTGAFLLAEAGVLDGHRATTHWARADDLQRRHRTIEVVADELYVDEGDILTSGGVSAGIDLCLHIVERDLGRDLALAAARSMVAPLHRSGRQRQYTPPDRVTGPAGPAVLREVTDWARSQLHRPITVTELADRAHQSPRTLARTFAAHFGQSPKAWLIQQRLAVACRLLEDPELSMEAVAARSGFGTASNLRIHFARAHQMPPSAYRAAFADLPAGDPRPAS
ncbi:MAG TPA: DJ-1/PfpI family protein [Candidatus Avipropionibacterium avicola]|uniref:DJ-1/PfpI family protein n=1 Tax=Candidatus Avipropionibacterium avicola TaxID=2840701 RepID=A0A9D1KNC2_9ACTN|nr:DJ-1/PfpI family protein [Candidatus Avipropionibacterium avicola]